MTSMNQNVNAELVKIEFHGQQIEAAEKDGQVWLVLRRLCENLGVNARSQRRKIRENPAFAERWCHMTTPSAGGAQDSFCVNLEVLSIWLGSISAARVKPEIRDTLIKYQRECMAVLKAHFFGAPNPPSTAVTQPNASTDLTPAQQALAMAQALVNIEQQQQAILQQQQQQDSRLATVEQQIQAQRRQRALEAKKLLALPEPSGHPQTRTWRSHLVQRMRVIGERANGKHQECWTKLYQEYYYVAGIDLKKRAKNRGYKCILDMAEALGVIQKLYDLCCRLWPSDLSDILMDTANTLSC